MKQAGWRALCAALALSVGMGGALAEWDGSLILRAEQALYALGYHGEECDSRMDEATVAALKGFQTANGLDVTGVPDEATMALLDSGAAVTCNEYLNALAQEYSDAPILQTGSSGDAVRRVQEALRNLGYFQEPCDGTYGESTMRAVRRFQLANGLEPTGMADRAAQLRLGEGTAVSWGAFLDGACADTGDFGTSVRRLQRALKSMGYYRGECTGEYGDLTQQAVLSFQRNNGMEETGAADRATCERLYSGQALALREEGTIYAGNTGEAVAEVQRRLAELGYYDRTVTGNFGPTTATSVRLFQMANGLSVTGELDSATRERMTGECASMDDAREALREGMAEAAVGTALGDIALRVRGCSFDVGDGEAQEGFAFVQYVCVAAGLPVVEPEELTARMTGPVEDWRQLSAGEVVRLRVERSDGAHDMLAIASGEGRVVYAVPDSPWVLESDIGTMNAAEVWHWAAENAQP